MVGVPRDIQQWTLITSRAQFQNFMRNLSVPESVLQPYIVRRAEAILPSVMDTMQSDEGDKTEDEVCFHFHIIIIILSLYIHWSQSSKIPEISVLI